MFVLFHFKQPDIVSLCLPAQLIDHLPAHLDRHAFLELRWVFRLEDFQPNGRELLRKATEAAPFVALRIPKTFDMKQLSELQMPYQVEDNLFDGKIYHKMVYFGG